MGADIVRAGVDIVDSVIWAIDAAVVVVCLRCFATSAIGDGEEGFRVAPALVAKEMAGLAFAEGHGRGGRDAVGSCCCSRDGVGDDFCGTAAAAAAAASEGGRRAVSCNVWRGVGYAILVSAEGVG